MPNFTLRWANRSADTQDWMVSNGDSFTLQSNHVRTVQVGLNFDYEFSIAVMDESGLAAAAELRYSAGTNSWTLTSHTPNEFALAQGNGIVTVRCFLAPAMGSLVQGARLPDYAITEAAGTAVDPVEVQGVLTDLRNKAAKILGSALGSKPLQPFMIGGQGGFPYFWQNPRDLSFNAKTYRWLSSAVKASASASAALHPGPAAMALVNAWKEIYGQLPSGDGPATHRVLAAIARDWSSSPLRIDQLEGANEPGAVLNAVPPTGRALLPLLSDSLAERDDAIASSVTGDSAVELGQSFNSAFIRALSSIAFSLSDDDQAKLTKAKADTVAQETAILNAWKSAYGSFPEGDGQPIDRIIGVIATSWADPATTLQGMADATDLRKLLSKAPPSGMKIIPVLSTYINAISSVIPIENAVSMNQHYITTALGNLQNPSEKNGGLLADDGKYYPAYSVSTQLSDILNGLKAESNKISVSMSITRTSEEEFSVKVSGGTSFKIPVLDFLTVGVDASADYFSKEVATSSNSIEVELTFTGVTLVNFAPLNYDTSQPKENWYWTDPIMEAIKIDDSNQTGFRFALDPNIDFSTNGPFGIVTGVAISNYPSVRITAKGSNYESVEKAFSQSASVDVSFLGIPLGIGGSESTYSHSAKSNKSEQSVTITLDPPPELVAGNSVDSNGWVLGVQTEYPAA